MAAFRSSVSRLISLLAWGKGAQCIGIKRPKTFSTNLDAHCHGLIDLFDGLFMLSLYLGQGIAVVILFSQGLVPLSNCLMRYNWL
jgi:hypothetical protein